MLLVAEYSTPTHTEQLITLQTALRPSTLALRRLAEDSRPRHCACLLMLAYECRSLCDVDASVAFVSPHVASSVPAGLLSLRLRQRLDVSVGCACCCGSFVSCPLCPSFRLVSPPLFLVGPLRVTVVPACASAGPAERRSGCANGSPLGIRTLGHTQPQRCDSDDTAASRTEREAAVRLRCHEPPVHATRRAEPTHTHASGNERSRFTRYVACVKRGRNTKHSTKHNTQTQQQQQPLLFSPLLVAVGGSHGLTA